MSRANRMLVAFLAVGVLIAGFWMIALGPKRQKADDLGKQVTRLEAQVAQTRQGAEFGREARKGFSADYQQLVVLGKAAPDDDDTGSFLVQLNRIAEHAGVEFRAIELTQTGSAVPVAAAPASGQPSVDEPPPAEGSADTNAVPVVSVAPATESAAAGLPIGATVGSAGLGAMPYELEFRGGFFEISEFLAGLDELVRTEQGRLDVDGRLVTIDGFSLTRDGRDGFPSVLATVAVTTYLTPSGQGVTAGAIPTGPTTAPVTTTPVVTTP